MAYTFLFFSLWCFSFVLYLAFPSLIPGGVIFLIPVSIQAVWMLKVSFTQRVMLAVCAGVLFDAVGSAPYGTHLISFLVMALVAGLLVAIISNSDSLSAQMLMTAVMVLLFAACVPLASLFLNI